MAATTTTLQAKPYVTNTTSRAKTSTSQTTTMGATSTQADISLTSMSIGLANMTLQQCACASTAISKQLTVSFNMDMKVISCQSDAWTVQCVNLTCPCDRSRQLTTYGSVCQIVYQSLIHPDVPRISAVLQSIVQITGVEMVVLPSHQLVWDESLLTWQPVLQSYVVIGTSIAFVVMIVVVLMGWYLYTKMVRPDLHAHIAPRLQRIKIT